MANDPNKSGDWHPSRLIALRVRESYDPRENGGVSVAREQRRLAAIIAADVVGYSRLIRPTLENILRRHAKHDLTDRLVVQYAPLALLRDRVDVAQTAFERIFLEHRHRAAIVKQRIDDLP